MESMHQNLKFGGKVLLWFGLLLMLGACGVSPRSGTLSPQISDTPVDDYKTADSDSSPPGQTIYEEQCAACHGLSGEGQPNWRQADSNGVLPAPPHDTTGHTWHHPDQVLLDVIANGSQMPNSKMIAYGDILTQEEMESVLVYIKTFWGEREREFQEQVTEQYLGK